MTHPQLQLHTFVDIRSMRCYPCLFDWQRMDLVIGDRITSQLFCIKFQRWKVIHYFPTILYYFPTFLYDFPTPLNFQLFCMTFQLPLISNFFVLLSNCFCITFQLESIFVRIERQKQLSAISTHN